MGTKAKILVVIVVLALGIAIPNLAVKGITLEPLDIAPNGTPFYSCGNGTIEENPLDAVGIHFNGPPVRLLRTMGLFRTVVSERHEDGFVVTAYSLFGIPLARAFYSCGGNICSGSSCPS